MACTILRSEERTGKIEPIARSRARDDINRDVIEPLEIARRALQKLRPALVDQVTNLLKQVAS